MPFFFWSNNVSDRPEIILEKLFVLYSLPKQCWPKWLFLPCKIEDMLNGLLKNNQSFKITYVLSLK